MNMKSDSSALVSSCADAIFAVIPLTMRLIRRQVRSHAGSSGLSESQLRVLLQVSRRPGVGVSAVSEHVGVSRPAGSALVDRLVRAGFLGRTIDPTERRRQRLELTPEGKDAVARAQQEARAWVQRELADLSEEDLVKLQQALAILGGLSSSPDALVAAADTHADLASGERDEADPG